VSAIKSVSVVCGIIAVCSVVHTKHVTALCGQKIEFFKYVRRSGIQDVSGSIVNILGGGGMDYSE